MGAISTFFTLAKANPLGLFMRAVPYLLAMAAIVFVLFAAYSWAYDNGATDERAKWLTAQNEQLTTEAEALVASVNEVDALNRKIRELELKYQAEDQAKSAKYQTEIKNVENNAKRTIAELRANAIRLRDPYPNSGSRYAQGGAGETGTTPGGCASEARGELSIETSEFLVDLASEADEVVEQLSYTQGLLVDCRTRAGALAPVIQ